MFRSTRKPAQVRTARGSFRCSSREANQLLDAGHAVVVSQSPFVVEIPSGLVITLLEGALAPLECRRFKADLESQWRLARGVMSWNESAECMKWRKSKRKSLDEQDERRTKQADKAAAEGTRRLSGKAAA